LLSSKKNYLLIERALQIPRTLPLLQPFRDRTHPDWFCKTVRNLTDTHLLEPFLYHPILSPPFTFDSRQVIRRLASSDAYDVWIRDGNLILPGFLSYLNHQRIATLVDQEFDLYKHHFQPHPTIQRMGFRRNMFYSLTQQLVRQDIGWYCLSAACRPTPHWRLITYPYVTKDADVGESLGFLHMDINIKRRIESGIGANQLTTSVSFDDETDDGCTVLVPGFYHHAQAWYDQLKARGQLDRFNGRVTSASSDLYTRADKDAFGEPEPFPCQSGGVRITRSETIHGSTPRVLNRRRVAFPWHTAIQDDHETLEIPGQHTWSEIAVCHRDMIAPTRGVGGNSAGASRPKSPFPAGIQMPSISPLCDALIGRRRWTDPEVLEERDIVLGPDNELAMRYIQDMRLKAVDIFCSCFPKMECIERRVYGDNSFFKTLDDNRMIIDS
jgi:hypothetical protein